MIREAYLRHIATLLLRFSSSIAPLETLDWGQAMLGELNHVEGHWAALMWALGGARVLVKHALASLIIPSRSRQAIPSHGELFAKEGSMRKVTFVTGGACVVAAVLFFFAPAFRQAFRISRAPWYQVFHVTSWNGLPGLEALAKRAETQHDPEGLVFAAVRTWDGRESARLAEEAVRLDPTLIWVYAAVAVRHPDLPEISQWVPKLESWDPQNALFHLITAESIDIDHVSEASKLPAKELQKKMEEDSAWQSAMAAAFASPKFDDYLDRLRELDRKVALRYGLNDPSEVLAGEEWDLPTYAFSDSTRFATSLLQSGEDLEARGDRKGALEKYWAVARFGQVIDSQGHTDSEHYMGSSLQAGAYKHLLTVSEKEANHEEAALFGYLAGKFNHAIGERRMSLRQRFPGQSVASWSASVVKASGLMMFVFGGLVLICAFIIVKQSRSLRPSALRVDRVTAALGLTGTVGLLLSSATLYVVYRPYSEIFERILEGDRSQVRELSTFLFHTRMLLGVDNFYRTRDFVFYFWTGVTLFSVIGLLLMGMRLFLNRPHASASA